MALGWMHPDNRGVNTRGGRSYQAAGRHQDARRDSAPTMRRTFSWPKPGYQTRRRRVRREEQSWADPRCDGKGMFRVQILKSLLFLSRTSYSESSNIHQSERWSSYFNSWTGEFSYRLTFKLSLPHYSKTN